MRALAPHRRPALPPALALLLPLAAGCERPVVGREFAGAELAELSVEPQYVRQAVPISVRFRLDGGPQGAVSLSLGAALVSCVPQRLADGRYECVHPGVSRQSHPQGPLDVEVVAKDRVGKETRASARITIDFDCPLFSRLDITPRIGTPGGVAELAIETNELLREPPIVSRGGAIWETATGTGTAFLLSHPVTDRDADISGDVVVRIADLAGNTSGDCGIDGHLPFGVDREVPEVNPFFVELRRDVPGAPTTLSAQPGAFSDDVAVGEVRILEGDSAADVRVVGSFTPGADGSVDALELDAPPVGRVWVQAVDVAGKESAPVLIRERWRLSAGQGTTPNAAVRTAVRYSPAPPRSTAMENRTRELAAKVFAEDTQSAEVTAHVGFRQIGTLPAGYRDTMMIPAGHDPVSGAIVAFGGRVKGTEDQRDETLILRWNELSAEYENTVQLAVPGQAPAARTGTNLAFDGSGCGVMFGGERWDGFLNDLWRVCVTRDGATWERLEASGAPAPRSTPILWDPTLRRFAISAGWSSLYGTDLYYLDPAQGAAGWRWVPITGLPDRIGDTDRLFHAFYYDPTLRGWGMTLGLVVPYYEGYTFWSYVDGLWSPSSVPVDLAGRTGFGYSHDSARSMLVVWGDDREEPGLVDPDTWVLAGDPRLGAQEWRRVNHSPSLARGWPSLVYDRAREATIVFGGARFSDVQSVPPVVEELVLSPSFPYLQASLDLATQRPPGIESLRLRIRATGAGDGDGVGPGSNRAGGVSVLLYDHEASQWREVASVETPPAGTPIPISAEVTEAPERFIGYDGVVPITVVTRWPATEDADARLDVDLVDGDLILAPAIPPGARIERFTISPPAVELGGTATVSWTVANAPEGIALYAGGTLVTESLEQEGTFSTRPTESTTLELRARNAGGGDATLRRPLVVRPSGAPPLILGFEPAKQAGPRGGTMRLAWRTERASIVRLLRGETEILATSTAVNAGSFDALLPIDPTVTSTSFTLEAKSEAGRELRQVTIRLAHSIVTRGPGAAQVYTEAISTPEETDLFVVELTAPGYIEATIYAPSAPDCVDADTTLTLYDVNLDYIVYDDDDGPERCSRIDRIDDRGALVPAGTYFLEVDDYYDLLIPAYTLEVATFPIECGNGVREPGESCDDGNLTSGDGCSSTCTFEAYGVYTAPADGRVTFTGALSPAGTVHVYQIDVTDPSFVMMESFAPDEASGCPDADTSFELFGEDPTTPIDTDDDGGVGYCSAISALLAPGTYYLAVHDLYDDDILPEYALVFDVITNLELEVEPNDAPAQATALGVIPAGTTAAPRSAALIPAGDDDYFSFMLAAPATVSIATYSDPSDREYCFGIDTIMTLYDSSQTELAFNDDNSYGGCARLDGIGGTDVELVGLPAGIYYVLIQDYGDDGVLPSYAFDVVVQ